MEFPMMKRFESCPNCDSKERFCEQLSQAAKDRGLGRKDWRFFLDQKQGVVLDPNRAVLLPVGAKAPAYLISLDICLDCGTVYAVELGTQEAIIRTQEIPRGRR